MEKIRIFRETSLPSTLEAYSIYMVAPASKPDYVEIYVTGATSSIIKRVVGIDDIQQMIQQANTISIVADIAERNSLNPNSNTTVLVLDATADTTVSSGAATYAYRDSDQTWTKISEAESLDISLDWTNVLNGPTSTPAEIDEAVSKSHSHSNLTELNKIGETAEGLLQYNNTFPSIAWNSIEW